MSSHPRTAPPSESVKTWSSVMSRASSSMSRRLMAFTNAWTTSSGVTYVSHTYSSTGSSTLTLPAPVTASELIVGLKCGSSDTTQGLSANPALQNNWTTTFLAEGVERVAEPAPETTEDLRVHLIKVDNAAALIDSGDMIQALHAAPLLRYLLKRADR